MSDTQGTKGRRGGGARGATVEAFLERLEHPHLAAIRLLRAAILSADPRIQESVKWNAPSFALGEHFATFKLRPVETVQIVLHTGASVTVSSHHRSSNVADMARSADSTRSSPRTIATTTICRRVRRSSHAMIGNRGAGSLRRTRRTLRTGR